jgi:hypothetical protein
MKLPKALMALTLVLLPILTVNTAQAQEKACNNDRVIEMTKLELGDDIIIAKMKNANCNFQLGDSDLVDLKKAGVSSKVIAAMLDTTDISSARVIIDKKLVVLHTFAQAKTGGRLGSSLTYGLKSVKEKAYLQNKHSSVIVSPTPVIELALPKDETIDNYIVVKMDEKSDRRELEVGSQGGIVGSKKGINAEAIRKTTSVSLGDNKFRMNVSEPLKPGEYILYVVGSANSVKEVNARGFDFTVE